MKKLAIITTHPIQYYAPLFRLISNENDVELLVFYSWGSKAVGPKYDPDFNIVIEWDIPLLEGYNYVFCSNIAKEPGSHHFWGIITPGLVDDIIAWGADVVWVWGWSYHSHLKVMRFFKGKIPVWFRGDSTLLDEHQGFSLKKIARRIMLRWIYRYVDVAFYVGTNNRDYYLAHGLKLNQLIYAPHAIDNLRFGFDDDIQTNERMLFRRARGIKDCDLVVLYAGKLEERKNPFFLLEFLKNIKLTKLKLLIVGNGPLQLQLQDKFRNDERVVFYDFVNQSWMPNLYKIADFFILPSLSETWGLGINEALASGTPVIASEKCGSAIDLIDSSNGYVIGLTNTDFGELENWMLNFNRDQTKIKESVSKFSYRNIVDEIIINLR